MTSSPDIIQELELKPKALNDRLMNAKDVPEANSIERELWALRTAIRHHKGKISKDGRRERSSPVQQGRSGSHNSSESA